MPPPVLTTLSQRLLPVLQLTRMALVFTAIADSTSALILRAFASHQPLSAIDKYQIIATIILSAGLYGFGMSLNDIIDRRRDSQIASHRPLPSGRIGVVSAHVICTLLALAAILGGAYFASSNAFHGYVSLALVIWTGLLIAFYDAAGKYLVAPGLLCLGLIRFFHATIPAPEIPILWHPLLLLNHVAILSTVAYSWEQKRPPLTRLHWISVLGGLAFIDALAILLKAFFHRGTPLSLDMPPRLLYTGVAILAFIAIAVIIKRKVANPREAGQTLMLYGLLWLIVYDATFVAAYTQNYLAAALVLLLAPIAYLSVQLMRWWSKLLIASQRPDYKRAGTA